MKTIKDRSSLQPNLGWIMAALNPFPSSIEKRALQWFTLLLSDTCTPSDLAKFEAWAKADKARQQAYQRLEALWEILGDFEDRPEVRALLDSV